MTDGLRSMTHAAAVHPRMPAAAPVLVTTKAFTALAPTVNADPALKPNQPNQSRPAPRTTMGMLWGSMESEPKPMRRPKITAAARAATPVLMCTTLPPAKSSAPIASIQPPPPDPVGHGSVDQSDPKHGEQHVGLELHALGEGARNEGGGDDGEHALKDHEGLMGDVVRVGPGLGGADVVEAHEFKAAE